jgi:hypothetical protein
VRPSPQREDVLGVHRRKRSAGLEHDAPAGVVDREECVFEQRGAEHHIDVRVHRVDGGIDHHIKVVKRERADRQLINVRDVGRIALFAERIDDAEVGDDARGEVLFLCELR